MGIIGVGAGLGMAIASQSEAADRHRPNILFILTDDQRWDALSCMGHAFVKTPNIDRIRHEGALFENAFVTTSLCSPARASFLTGTYAHTNGVTGNWGCEYDPDRTPPFPLVLQRAGYYTAYVGKWHMGTDDQPRAGFDYWLSFKGQGVYLNPPLNENGRSFKAKGYMTDILTDYALKQIRRKHDRPFCLVLSHKAVHGPFTPAPRHKDDYAADALPKRPNMDDTFEGKPEWMRAGFVRGGRRVLSDQVDKPIPPSLPPIPFNATQKSRMDYYRAINAVDEGVGRVFDALEETGQLDNTVIVFAGDNGYFHGEHRRGDKRVMYEEALRIPLLMRYPKLVKVGATVKPMVLNIDVAPTLLDLAGVEAPAVTQGRSLRPLFAEDKAGKNWRRSFLYEYWVDMTDKIPRMVGVRTDQWKYVRYPDIDDLDEMYDLAADQYEMKNLAYSPEHKPKRDELDAEVTRLMRETGYKNAQQPIDPVPAAAASATGLILHYDFSKGVGPKIVNQAGRKALAGKATNATQVDSTRGKAMRLSGKGYVTAPRVEALIPYSSPWVVEAWGNAEQDGMVMAHGGEQRGYALFIEGGKPFFGVSEMKRLYLTHGRESVIGKWTHLVGVIRDQCARLYVDGNLVSAIALPRPFQKGVNDTLAIGADIGSPIDPIASKKHFRGLIQSVRIWRQEMDADDVRRLYDDSK